MRFFFFFFGILGAAQTSFVEILSALVMRRYRFTIQPAGVRESDRFIYDSAADPTACGTAPRAGASDFSGYSGPGRIHAPSKSTRRKRAVSNSNFKDKHAEAWYIQTRKSDGGISESPSGDVYANHDAEVVPGQPLQCRAQE
jgi:hypothetical protein